LPIAADTLSAAIAHPRTLVSTQRDARHRKRDCAVAAAFGANVAWHAFDQRLGRETRTQIKTPKPET
jgi:hypothetical protein